MKKYFCDRCKSEEKQILLGEINIVGPGPVANTARYELCVYCYNDLMNLLKKFMSEQKKRGA